MRGEIDTCRGFIHPQAPAVGQCPWCVEAHELQREDDAKKVFARLSVQGARRARTGKKQKRQCAGQARSYATFAHATKPPRRSAAAQGLATAG